MFLPGFRGLSPFSIARKSISDFLEDDMSTHASALAYQVLFSIFPFIIFLIALLGFLHLSNFFDWLRQHAQLLLPEQAMGQVNSVIDELQQQRGGLLSFGMIVALWSASSAIRAIMNALNVAYDVEEKRPAWKLYPLSILYTLGLALMLVLAAILMSVGPEAIEWIAGKIGLESLFVTLWTWLRWPVALLLMVISIAAIYYVAPSIDHRFQLITPGATFAVLAWIAASLGFNYYVGNFANYSAMYGSIGTIIVLLLYFFISAAVLLLGAEINSAIEHQALAKEKQVPASAMRKAS